MTGEKIRFKFGTYDYDTIVADTAAVVEDWDYAPNGRKWRPGTDGLIRPYVRRDLSIGASARGQGALNFDLYLYDVTTAGYSWLRYDSATWNRQYVKRVTVFVPNADAEVSAYTAAALDEQWVCVQCEATLWDITNENLKRREAAYNASRFLTLQIKCFNGVYSETGA